MKKLLTVTLLITGAALCISPANASEKPCEQKPRHEIKQTSSEKSCDRMAKARERMKKRYNLQKSNKDGVKTQNCNKKGCDIMNKDKKEEFQKTDELQSKCKNGNEESCSRMKKFTKRITNKIQDLRGKGENCNGNNCGKAVEANKN